VSNQSFLSVALSRQVVPRALKVALLVGTLLALINHGDKILALSLTGQDWIKVALTYLVPYGVSTWSAVGVIRGASVDRSVQKEKLE